LVLETTLNNSMTDASIPLSVRPPQIESPVQMAGQMLSLQDLRRRQQMADLEAREMQQQYQMKQMQMDESKALNDAIRQNISTDASGNTTINYEGVNKTLAQSGHGITGSKFSADRLKIQQETAKYFADQIKAHGEALGTAAQAFGAVKTLADRKDANGNPIAKPEDLETAFQRARQMGASALKASGLDPNVIPEHYDPIFVEQAFNTGMKGAEQARNNYEAADLALRRTVALPKTVDEWRKHIGDDLATAADRNQWDAKRAKWRELGAPPEVLNSFPNTYTSQAAADAGKISIPSQDRAKVEQQNLALTSQKMLATTGNPDDYQNAWNQLPDEQKRFFPKPEEFDYTQTPITVRRAGMTPTEQARYDATEAHQNATLDLSRQRLDLERQRVELTKTENARSMSADKRQATSEISKLAAQEDGLNRSRYQLGNAITRRDLFIPPTGPAKPIAEAAKEQGTTVDALMSDMMQRYRSAGDQLKRVIRDKYQNYERLGATPHVPIENVESAIDAGYRKTFVQGAARQLAEAQNKDQYADILRNIDPTIGKEFPAADQWDAEKTPQAVWDAAKKLATSPAQSAQPQQSETPGGYSTGTGNNPLNITLGPATQKYVDSGEATVKAGPGGLKFLVFKDPVAGFRAGTDLLFGPTYADKPAGLAMAQFSGGSYGPEVVKSAGLDPRQPLSKLTPQQKDALVAAIAKQEGWKQPLPNQGAVTQPAQQPSAGKPVSNTNQPAKITEAEARRRAAAAGKDANWYVGELRKRNLIQ
ncbi:MAG: hypothetical protein M1541_05240, partial [Acidobacteria bacterium]|nr:hypothetical protein [Acidobacteriota bacterium]